MSGTRLYRSEDNRMIAGVAGGLADYFNADISLVRLLWVLAIFIGGGGVLAYIIAWIVIPEKPFLRNEGAVNDETPSPVIETPQTCQESDNAINHRRFSYIGLFLVILGVFFLLKQIFPWEISRYFWPFILIALGILLLLPRRSFHK